MQTSGTRKEVAMPIYRGLPDKPRLSHLKRQAKELLADWRDAKPDAKQRLVDSHPRGQKIEPSGAKLSDAELVVAREYGFASWPMLHDYLTSRIGEFKDELRTHLKAGDVAEATRLLDAHPALVTARFAPHNDTPLHLAASDNLLDLAGLLIDHGANLTARNTWRGTPLFGALIHGHTQMAALLVSRGAEIATLEEAAGVGDVTLLRRLWGGSKEGELATPLPDITETEPGIWISEGSKQKRQQILQSAFEYACRNGRIAAAEFLLECGAEIGGSGFFGAQPIHWAAGRGKAEMVRFLVQRGADMSVRDPKFNGTAYGWAQEHGEQETKRVLRDLGYQLDIWEAAADGDLTRVQDLVREQRQELDAKRWGTPLAIAASAKRSDVVRWLLAEGADARIATRDGQTPLDLARSSGATDIVALLEAHLAHAV
jgi:ankyrin repeat protein